MNPAMANPANAAMVSRRVRPLALLLLALGAAWAPHAEKMPVWMAPTLAVLAALRLYMAYRGYELKHKKLLLLPTLLGAWWAMSAFNSFFGGTGAIALLTVMVALKLFESFALRDFLLLALTGYVLTATRILYGQTMATALWMAVLCVAFTYLLVEYSDRTGRRPARVNFRITARLFIFALPVMALLYLFFPRTGSPLWMLSGGSKAITGMTDELRPGSISELVTSDEVAFTVEFDTEVPPPSERYWRGLVFDRFDGEAWRGSGLEPAVAPAVRPAARPTAEPGNESGNGSGNASGDASGGTDSPALRFEQRITLFPHTGRWLYALDRPVSAVLGKATLHRDGTLLTRIPVKNQLNYRVSSVTAQVVTAQVVAAQAVNAQLLQELTQKSRAQMVALPEGYSPRIHALADELVNGAAVATANTADRSRAGDDVRIVAAALDYFRREGFVYTLTPQAFQKNPIENFLLESREGFCEHFATGFAVVMRAAGVPTRIVAGYLGAETNPWFNQLMILQEHAHAWNEVWLEGRGWVRVDPTAEANPDRLAAGIDTDASLDQGFVQFGEGNNLLQNLANSLGFSYLTVNRWWSEWVVGYNRQKQLEFLQKLGTGAVGRAMLLALCALMTATWLAAVMATILTGESKRTDPFERLWRKWLRKMKRAGHQPNPNEGPLDFGRRIAKEQQELASEVLKITTFYSRCRYGRPLEKDLKERVKVFGGMVKVAKLKGK